MADLLGPSAGIEGALTDWGNYWGQVDQRARLRYDHREARDEREREHQYQLERARSNQSAYAGRAGLFENADARFNNMGPRNVPVAPGATPGLTPEQVAGNAQFAEYMTRPGNVNENTQPMLPRGERQTSILTPRDMTPEQSRVWWQFVHATRENDVPLGRYNRVRPGVTEDEMNTWRRRLREVGIELENGNPVTSTQGLESATGLTWPGSLGGTTSAPNSPSATATIPPAYENTPTPQAPESNDPLFRGPNTQTYPGGLEPPDAASRAAYQDTSGPLAPTPEMQMLETVVQDRLRLARLAADHGRNTEAEQMFAEALQGQAAYLQQERLVSLRAASQGHQTALANLFGLYSGRPPGTTRLQQVGNTNQYNLQVLAGNGQWTNTPAGPFTYERLFQTARGLVDREAVMAESEANSEIIRARISAGADVQVASIRALTDQQRMYVDAAIAQMEAGSRERIAQGNAELVVDSTNNRAYLQWWEPGPNGQPMQIVREISEQDVRVPDTNGRQTQRQMVGRNVTGIVGVRGN